jgi:hypothetical protein
LKSRRIDFALVFAVSESQLNGILHDIMPALKEDSKLWIAFPKLTSKIATDLNRESSWNKLAAAGYESLEQVSLDHVWNAAQFRKIESEEFEIAEVEEVSFTVAKKTKKSAASV